LLDVLLLPDGTCRVLDRDELAHARAEGLDPALAALAEEGVREVLDLIATGRPPFGRESMQSGKRPTPG
jgi:predicted RNA-binding protein associated with RNAse of E/G family